MSNIFFTMAGRLYRHMLSFYMYKELLTTLYTLFINTDLEQLESTFINKKTKEELNSILEKIDIKLGKEPITLNQLFSIFTIKELEQLFSILLLDKQFSNISLKYKNFLDNPTIDTFTPLKKSWLKLPKKIKEYYEDISTILEVEEILSIIDVSDRITLDAGLVYINDDIEDIKFLKEWLIDSKQKLSIPWESLPILSILMIEIGNNSCFQIEELLIPLGQNEKKLAINILSMVDNNNLKGLNTDVEILESLAEEQSLSCALAAISIEELDAVIDCFYRHPSIVATNLLSIIEEYQKKPEDIKQKQYSTRGDLLISVLERNKRISQACSVLERINIWQKHYKDELNMTNLPSVAFDPPSLLDSCIKIIKENENLLQGKQDLKTFIEKMESVYNPTFFLNYRNSSLANNEGYESYEHIDKIPRIF